MDSSEKPNSSPDLSGTLEGILSNPAMMSMISSMASELKKGGGFPSPQDVQEETAAKETEKAYEVPSEASVNEAPASLEAKLPEAISAIAPLLSGNFSKRSPADERRVCLLRALKPYMSEGRGEAIEAIIKISQISDLLKNFT